MATQKIKVWDPLVRVFHWALVLFFMTAFVTEDDFQDIHVLAGYGVAGLIMFRIIWGLIGTRYARFTNFVRPPAEVKSYLRDVVLFRAKHYIGHNPAGGAMIIALLVSLIMTVFFGMLTYGATESAGPLAGWVAGASHGLADGLEEVHEFFANFTLLLVGVHVVGVLVAMLQHGENLVQSMIHGYKTLHSSDK